MFYIYFLSVCLFFVLIDMFLFLFFCCFFFLVLDEVYLTIKTHDLGTNPRDFQSGRTISEIEKPIPKIKIQGNICHFTFKLTD